jgi:hypothetical protein
MGSTRAGLIGAAFLAFSFQHVADSHYVTVDVPMTLFAFWAIILVVEDLSGRSRLRVWPFAPIAAYAILCKLPAFVIFVPFLLAAWLRGGLRGPEGLISRKTAALGGATIAIYCVANPGVVLEFGRFATSIFAVFTPASDGGAHYAGVEQKTNLWAFYGQALLHSQGPALLALAVIGAVIGVARRSQGVILHLAFIVPFFFLIAAASTAHLYYPRYIVPMLPGLCLIAGLALDDLVQRIQRAPRPAGILAAAIALLIVIEPGLAAATWSHRLTRTDTRTQAAQWVESNVEHRARVLLEGFPEEAAQLAVPLRNTKKNIRDMVEELRSRDPGKATYWEMRADLQDKPMYDLVTVRHFQEWGGLDEYVGDGVEYVVLRREFFVPGERSASKSDEDVVTSRYRFYVDLVAHQNAERVAFFTASEYGDPGYDIEIWRLLPSGEDQTLEGADTTETAS